VLLSAGLVIPRLLSIGGGEEIIRNKQKMSPRGAGMKEKLLSALAHASERCELQQKVESSVGRVFGIVNK